MTPDPTVGRSSGATTAPRRRAGTNRPRFTPFLVLLLDAALLFGGVQVGLRLPALADADHSSPPELQYGDVRGRFSALRGGFLGRGPLAEETTFDPGLTQEPPADPRLPDPGDVIGDLIDRVPVPPADEVIDVPLRFVVRNLNRSRVPCASDAAEWTLGGRLITSAETIDRPEPSVTLYAHGAVIPGTEIFRVSIPGYNYAEEMARLGHASVVVDRIGYGTSGIPNGFFACVGAHADVLNQVVGHLRDGTYDVEGLPASISFDRVALAGHSLGGYIAPVVAYSFKSVDALALLSAACCVFPPPTGFVEAWAHVAAVCGRGGEAKSAGQPAGYVQTWTSLDGVALDVEPAVERALLAAAERDPCGDLATVLAAGLSEPAHASEVDVPVLVVGGTQDPLATEGDFQRQAGLYRGDVTLRLIEGIGHLLPVERRTPAFRQVMHEWLSERGF